MIRRLLREPLLHFLFAGALLFILHYSIKEGDEEGRTIVVDKPALLNFVQYRAKLFRPDFFQQGLDQMPKSEFDAIVQDYVDEEILYREARAYDLANGDDVIRQRLIQKSQFLLSNEEDLNPSEATLRGYFTENKSRYINPLSLTLTHVFLDGKLHGGRAEAEARAIQAQLNRDHVVFSDAPLYGDRFPFLLNYVDRPVDFIESHFGYGMTRSLASLKPDSARWQGPLQSPYGWHVVLLVNKAPATPLTFEQVREDVREAYIEESRVANQQKALERLRQRYRVRLEVDRHIVGQGG